MAAFINNPQRAKITDVAKEVAAHLVAMLSFNSKSGKPQSFSATLQPSLFDNDAPFAMVFDRLVREVVLAADDQFQIKLNSMAVAKVLNLTAVESPKVSIDNSPPRRMLVVQFNWEDAYKELWTSVLKADLRDLFNKSVGSTKEDTQLERTFVYEMNRTVLEGVALNKSIFAPGAAQHLERLLTDVLEEILIERKLGNVRRSTIVSDDKTVYFKVTVVEDDDGNVLKA